MKNRLSLTIGILFWGVSLMKAGMTWEEWTPENGIIDGQAALQEMLEAGKMPDENWQEKALAFINAFEKLKLQLQFFWRSQVGDGATDWTPWNGIPGIFDRWEKQGYIKRDCPIVLHFWANGHIGQCTSDFGLYLFDSCFPESAMLSESQQKKIKGNLKRYVYSIFSKFSKKDLKKCALLLNQNFCRPVSKLIIHSIENLKKQKDLQKQDLEVLFKLYGVYDNIDMHYPICIQESYGQVTELICDFVVDCCYDISAFNHECKTWVINLFRNYNANPYKTESVGIGQYNLNITNILEKFILKIKMKPAVLDSELIQVLSIVIEQWQKEVDENDRVNERNEMLIAWNQACASLHNALYNY